jgi:hypothetical protein
MLNSTSISLPRSCKCQNWRFVERPRDWTHTDQSPISSVQGPLPHLVSKPGGSDEIIDPLLCHGCGSNPLDLVRKMAAGCEAKAKEMNWKMNMSVVDSGANQIFLRKNGRRLFGQW